MHNDSPASPPHCDDAEEWRPVPGYEGVYEVSDHGRVHSIARILRNGRRMKGCMLKPWINPWGYPVVGLRLDGAQIFRPVHRLVALAFLGPTPEGQEVRHLDGDSSNCALTNLAYGTHRENVQDSLRHGTNRNARKTYCDDGHEFTPDNIYWNSGGRRCKTCTKADAAARHDRMKDDPEYKARRRRNGQAHRARKRAAREAAGDAGAVPDSA
jgi:NUMOD4 motif-containing protein/HNH endonuclease